ncbi:unnamed protein product [Amoebophrya sp. A120]|nr:unnamed protein product [Amoebophrya sp. A120]|eukprot:GSA120T00017969001.1
MKRDAFFHPGAIFIFRAMDTMLMFVVSLLLQEQHLLARGSEIRFLDHSIAGNWIGMRSNVEEGTTLAEAIASDEVAGEASRADVDVGGAPEGELPRSFTTRHQCHPSVSSSPKAGYKTSSRRPRATHKVPAKEQNPLLRPSAFWFPVEMSENQVTFLGGVLAKPVDMNVPVGQDEDDCVSGGTLALVQPRAMVHYTKQQLAELPIAIWKQVLLSKHRDTVLLHDADRAQLEGAVGLPLRKYLLAQLIELIAECTNKQAEEHGRSTRRLIIPGVTGTTAPGVLAKQGSARVPRGTDSGDSSSCPRPLIRSVSTNFVQAQAMGILNDLASVAAAAAAEFASAINIDLPQPDAAMAVAAQHEKSKWSLVESVLKNRNESVNDLIYVTKKWLPEQKMHFLEDLLAAEQRDIKRPLPTAQEPKGKEVEATVDRLEKLSLQPANEELPTASRTKNTPLLPIGKSNRSRRTVEIQTGADEDKKSPSADMTSGSSTRANSKSTSLSPLPSPAGFALTMNQDKRLMSSPMMNHFGMLGHGWRLTPTGAKKIMMGSSIECAGGASSDRVSVPLKGAEDLQDDSEERDTFVGPHSSRDVLQSKAREA